MEYLIHILILYCVLATLALGFAVSVGGAGIINLSYLSFMAIGAYATAIATTRYGWPIALGFALAVVVTSCIAAALGIIMKRVRGDILVVLTLAFHFAVFSLLLNWGDFTRGALGIPGIARPAWFETPEQYLALAIVVLAGAYVFLRALARAPFGRVLGAVRDDEIAASVLGKNVVRAKRITYVVTGAVAGLAGALYAHYIQFIDPKSFHLDQIVFLLTVIIVGGLGSLEGALMGTALTVFIPEALRFTPIPPALLGPVREILFSIVVVLILIYRPRGILGKVLLR